MSLICNLVTALGAGAEIVNTNKVIFQENIVKPVRHKIKSSCVIVTMLLLLTLGGCLRYGIQVIPVPNQNVLVLNADEVVQILRQTGFTDQQIQKHGWSVREGLAKSGAVRIMIDDIVEAGFAVRGDEVFISSRSRGYWIYNINTGWVNVPPGR